MDLEQCKQKAVAMLRDYHNNEVCIQMLQGDLQALQQLRNYNRNWQYATYRCEKCGETYYFDSGELQSGD